MANFFGTPGNDNLIGTDADDSLFGNDGNDTLDGRFGFDLIDGGNGNDTTTYTFYAGGINANLQTGAVAFPGNSDRTDTLVNIENVIGSQGDDVITGDGFDNFLSGGAGNDILDGDFGFDTLDGGTGIDTATYAFYAGGINADLRTGTVSFPGNGDRTDTLINIENVIGSQGNDVITGDGFDNYLAGGAGDDILDGDFGFDTLDGGTGTDTATYAFYFGGINADLQTGAVAFPGNGDRTDTLISIENLVGSGGNDVIAGNDLDNTLSGGDGNDTLEGRGGKDTLIGGAGDDTYILSDASDTVVEAPNAGIDTVNAGFSYTLGDNVENLKLTGSANINGTGNALKNTLIGNDGNNVLNGKEDNDTLIGGLGNDIYVVNDAGDVVTEGSNAGLDIITASVSYTLSDNVEHMVLTGSSNLNATGNAGDNILLGNSGVNTLTGGAGKDTLIGVGGQDVLKGGTGADKFFFSAPTDGVDRILDFSKQEGDKIVFAANSFTGLSGNQVQSNQFVLGRRALDANDRVIYNKRTGNLFYDADGKGGAAQVKIATFDNKPTLGANDFSIVASPLAVLPTLF